jgi:hypothetical protein
MTDRRAERNEILARADGWVWQDERWVKTATGDEVQGEWSFELPNYHSLDALAEVLRGMTEEEQGKVIYGVREIYHEAFFNGKAKGWTEFGWVLLVMTPDDLAEAICAVIEGR